MVQIQNSDAINAIRNGARLSISESFPQDLGKTVVPVMDMTPDFHRYVNVVEVRYAATGGTVYTTPTDKDFYLTGLSIGGTKDGAATGTKMQVNVTLAEGGVVYPISLGFQTTTAESRDIVHMYTVPIKLKRNSAVYITLTGTFTNAHTEVLGYTVEAPIS